MPKTPICQLGQALALALLLNTFGPAHSQAKDGRDDGSSSSHTVPVAAAACTELPGAPGTASGRFDGAFTVRDGAAASLICALPTDELATSSGGGAKPMTFQIAYLDSDGPGAAAMVTVELVQTVLAADPDGFTDSAECAWTSAAGGAVVGTTASVVCGAGIVEDGFYHLRVELRSGPGSAASFVGVVARR